MLVEMLDGIGGCLIYIKKTEYSQENTEIRKILNTPHKIYEEQDYIIIRAQKIFDTPEIESLEMKINSEFEGAMKIALKKISCLCGCTCKKSKTTLRLPSEGWEELVDMWSCHNREFAHMVEQEIKPKKDGILYSTLYIIMEHERMPVCLATKENKNLLNASITKESLSNTSSTCKIFYNQIKTCVPDEYFLFHYLYDLFQVFQEMQIEKDSILYSIRLLDITHTYCGPLLQAPPLELSLKLAYTAQARSPHSKPAENKNMNEHYMHKLIEILLKNSIQIEINSRSISFIRRVPIQQSPNI